MCVRVRVYMHVNTHPGFMPHCNVCRRVLMRSRGWKSSVEQVPLKEPHMKALIAGWAWKGGRKKRGGEEMREEREGGYDEKWTQGSYSIRIAPPRPKSVQIIVIIILTTSAPKLLISKKTFYTLSLYRSYVSDINHSTIRCWISLILCQNRVNSSNNWFFAGVN